MRAVPARIVCLLILLATFAAACGTSSAKHGTTASAAPTPVRVVLDFVPNAVHVGLYAAQAEGFYRRQRLAVKLVAPAGTAQPLSAVSSGRADIGLADLIDVTLANRQGAGLRVVAAVVQRPLISLMARADGPITRPRDLVGHTVGLTGVPSDRAIARTIIAGDGGDPDKVHFVVIGFSAVPSLVGRKVDAAIGFWPADGVELQRRVADRIFRLERFGGPAFPELVIFARARTLQRSPGLVRRFLRATSEGYAVARRDPSRALSDLEAGAHGIDPAVARASLRAYRPILADARGRFGSIDRAEIAAFLRYARRTGIIPGATSVRGLLWATS
ncbi:MAG: putative hydroxymethylpyrimidine transport system substrate-binding protein [Gaiellales bacterium]|nr:putative hydroxymethylpyrimidine transport system substrate-binding protein [Gaiellales bacterium]